MHTARQDDHRRELAEPDKSWQNQTKAGKIYQTKSDRTRQKLAEPDESWQNQTKDGTIDQTKFDRIRQKLTEPDGSWQNQTRIYHSKHRIKAHTRTPRTTDWETDYSRQSCIRKKSQIRLKPINRQSIGVQYLLILTSPVTDWWRKKRQQRGGRDRRRSQTAIALVTARSHHNNFL